MVAVNELSRDGSARTFSPGVSVLTGDGQMTLYGRYSVEEISWLMGRGVVSGSDGLRLELIEPRAFFDHFRPSGASLLCRR